MRRITLVIAALEGLVEGTDVFTSETLDDEYDHILLREGAAVACQWFVDGGINGSHLFFAGIIVGHFEYGLAYRAI